MVNEDRPVVAAFDVDGTLTVRDCVRPFLVEVAGYRSLALSVVRRPLDSAAAALRRDRDRLKEIVVGGALRRRSSDEVDRIGVRFAEQVNLRWLRADTTARLRWHQRRGHRTVLVSASLGPYLRPLGRTLGVDAVLCTEPRVADGRLLDGLDGPNCRAEVKLARLRTWLDEQGLTTAEVWAYGDSAGDRAMLEAADHAVWVRGRAIDEQPVAG